MSHPPLSTLVRQHLLPNGAPSSAREDAFIEDTTEFAQSILDTHLTFFPGGAGALDGRGEAGRLREVGDQIRQRFLRQGNTADALRVSNLLGRLEAQHPRVLSDPAAHLQFLLSLALSAPPPSDTHPNAPTSRPPTRAERPPTRASAAHPPPAPPPPQRAEDTPPEGLTKAEVLRRWREGNDSTPTPAPALLRDVVYILQGIDGAHVRFSSSTDAAEVGMLISFDSNTRIPRPTFDLIVRLSELGWLYKRVSAFLRPSPSTEQGQGLIAQSLSHHIQAHLTDYYRLIAVLESQLSRPGVRPDAALTLGRLGVWTEEWRLRMRMMSAIVEGAADAHGGALVSLIHGYTDNGDPFIRKFTASLLEEVSKPFFHSLHTWITSGELLDPFDEFFVALNPDFSSSAPSSSLPAPSSSSIPNVADAQNGAPAGAQETGRIWENKYVVRDGMRPKFVGEGFGRKIFSTGKSLNFIRYSCRDEDWVSTRNKLSSADKVLKYSDIPSLERSIDVAFSIASQRLLEVLFDKFRLLDHLAALKRYLMLGAGDFIDILMESLGPSLARPANTLYRHNLTATLEAAVRGSNASFDDPSILRRLDARMLEYSRGEIGWDVFTLEYRVDAPLDAVLDPEAMRGYRKVFNWLWRLKRVEMELGRGWKRAVVGKRTFLKVPELDHDWHQARLAMAEMIHFVRQLQAYAQLEVIECSWAALLEFANKREGDLDALIAAHREYLDRIVGKVLLLGGKGRGDEMLQRMRKLLRIILEFRAATDDLYALTLSLSSTLNPHPPSRSSTPSTTHPDAPAGSDEALHRARTQVARSAGEFQELALQVVLGLQAHPDLDVRFLAVRLGFNAFYRKGATAAGGSGGGGGK